MATSTTPMPLAIEVEEYGASQHDERAEFVEAPERRNRSARGAITGILLGAGLWSAILFGFGVIKL